MAEPRSGPGRPGLPLRILGSGLLASGPLAAALFYTAPAWSGTLERVYGAWAYPILDRVFSAGTGWSPWSLGELLGLGLLAGLGVGAARAAVGFARSAREGFLRLRRLGFWVAAALSSLYAGFVLAWGLNYQRPPLAARLGWGGAQSTAEDLKELCTELAVQVNGLRQGMEPDEDATRVLVRAAEGYARLGAALAPAVPELRTSRPKFALASGLMSRSLTHGMVLPWTHEALINRSTPSASLPFALCHEMAHQRGIAREDEANFVGYLAGRLHPEATFRYSALRFALGECLAQLAQNDPAASAAVVQSLDPVVREDYRRDAAWVRARRSRFSEVQGRTYDRYLKAQGQREGIRSYGRVVDLLLAERRLRREGRLPEALR